MQVGRMKSREEAEKYIDEKMHEVKEILDDVADQTGIVFICFSGSSAEMFAKIGNILSEQLISIMRVVPDRVELANKAWEIANAANEKAAEEAKALSSAEQGDLFRDVTKMEGNA